MDTPRLACTLVGSDHRCATISNCYSRQRLDAHTNTSECRFTLMKRAVYRSDFGSNYWVVRP